MTLPNRIGVLGGTFNPVHMGHLILAQTAVEMFELSSVLFVPSSIPPHKGAANLISAEHRMAMLTVAVEDNPAFLVSDTEIKRGGTSYTVDTVAHLYERERDSEIFFIIGADTLPELHQWRDIYSILPLCRIATFGRPGLDLAALTQADLHLEAPWPERLLRDVRMGRQVEISSSEIRYRIAEGMSIRYLVPPLVEMYIAEHRLYGR